MTTPSTGATSTGGTQSPLTDPALSKAQQRALRKRVAHQMYVQGLTPSEIQRRMAADGAVFALSTIARDCQELEEEWRRRLLDDPVRVRSRELANIDELRQQAWAQYFQAITGRQPTIAQGWMAQMVKLMERKAKLLGLDTVVPVPGSSPDDPLYTKNVDDPSIDYSGVPLSELEEELERLKVMARGARN